MNKESLVNYCTPDHKFQWGIKVTNKFTENPNQTRKSETFEDYQWLYVWNQQGDWPATPPTLSGVDCMLSCLMSDQESNENRKTHIGITSNKGSNKGKIKTQRRRKKTREDKDHMYMHKKAKRERDERKKKKKKNLARRGGWAGHDWQQRRVVDDDVDENYTHKWQNRRKEKAWKIMYSLAPLPILFFTRSIYYCPPFTSFIYFLYFGYILLPLFSRVANNF